MYFDARAAKLLKPGEHMTIDAAPGLRLKATQTRRTWVYRYKADGLMKQVKIGLWPDMSIAQALASWQALRDGKGAGIDPQQSKRVTYSAEPGGASVRDVIDGYIAGHLATMNTPAAEVARRALLRLMDESPDLANKSAAAVTRADAFRVIDQRKQYPTAAAKLKAHLAAAWNYAHDSGGIDDTAANWWRDVHRGRLKSRGKVVGGKHQGPTRRVLHIDEVRTLLAWSAEHMHALAYDVLVMYLWTGARGGEIVSMRPEHVTQEPTGLWWTVPVSITKNAGIVGAVDLRVPLIGKAREVVTRRLSSVGKSGWLFEDARGEQYTQHDFSTYVYDLQPYSKKAQRAALNGSDRPRLPVTGWTPHNLRRTARTLLAGLGCPREIGEAILGHMPPVIEATYNAYSYDAERVLWLGRLDGSLGG